MKKIARINSTPQVIQACLCIIRSILQSTQRVPPTCTLMQISRTDTHVPCSNGSNLYSSNNNAFNPVSAAASCHEQQHVSSGRKCQSSKKTKMAKYWKCQSPKKIKMAKKYSCTLPKVTDTPRCMTSSTPIRVIHHVLLRSPFSAGAMRANAR